jgi:hypothetical protein
MEEIVSVITYYSKSHRVWVAYGVDLDGNQVGDAMQGLTKEDAAFNLGRSYQMSFFPAVAA